MWKQRSCVPRRIAASQREHSPRSSTATHMDTAGEPSAVQQVWKEFWEAVEFVQAITVDPEAWAADFVRPMVGVLTLAEQVAIPGGIDAITWTASDATLEGPSSDGASSTPERDLPTEPLALGEAQVVGGFEPAAGRISVASARSEAGSTADRAGRRGAGQLT